MSRLDVNTLRHTAGSADNITLDNSQNVTVEGTLTVDGPLSYDGTRLKVNSTSTYYADDLIVGCAHEGGITIAAEATTNSNYLMFADATSGTGSYAGYINYYHTNNKMSFATDSVVRAELDTTGLKINDGNLVIGTAGHGIDFSAHGNAGGMTSELLDDYEVGTFTPAWNQGSSSAAMMSATAYESYTNGKYIKIGNFVSFTIVIECSSHTARSGTQVILAGLPFTSENSDAKGGAYFTIAEGVSNNIENANVTIRQQNNASYLQFFKTNGAYFLADTTGASWNDKLEIAGHYWAG